MIIHPSTSFEDLSLFFFFFYTMFGRASCSILPIPPAFALSPQRKLICGIICVFLIIYLIFSTAFSHVGLITTSVQTYLVATQSLTC